MLSVPYFPDVPGRDDFRGEQHHTGLWPPTPVDFAGKRVAVIGTGSSGVQVVPAIVDEVASLTVYQRTANWCTPLNNAPITPDEQAQLRADFEALRETLNTSLSGFLHPVHDRADVRRLRTRSGGRSSRRCGTAPASSKLTSNYIDLLFNHAANDEWCEFIAEKIREHRRRSRDRGAADPEGPPVRREAAAVRHRLLRGVQRPERVARRPPRDADRARDRDAASRPTDGVREFDIIVWATGFDFGTGALTAWGSAAATGSRSTDHWADGPTTFLGVQTRGFPNFFFPGGPHAAAGNNPRYNGDQVDFVTDTLVYARDHGYDVIEVEPEAEERWTAMVDRGAAIATFGESSYYFGANIPGKPRRYLLNAGGRPKLFEVIADVVANDYKGFTLSRSSAV